MLNKKILRKFATDNPAPGIPPGHGLLHAEQVKYIVRTAVKIIGHHRILVLYIYSCERVVNGDNRPIWTMFQMGTSDYITLARKDDGSTTWRAACFERLGNDYNFASKCAFYSQTDETCVSRYLHSTDTGFLALCKAQENPGGAAATVPVPAEQEDHGADEAVESTASRSESMGAPFCYAGVPFL